jgi:hypothetical protein
VASITWGSTMIKGEHVLRAGGPIDTRRTRPSAGAGYFLRPILLALALAVCGCKAHGGDDGVDVMSSHGAITSDTPSIVAQNVMTSSTGFAPPFPRPKVLAVQADG